LLGGGHCGFLGMGGEFGGLDLETTMMGGGLVELFYFLSFSYSRLLAVSPGGYSINGVLACMDDLVLLTIDGVWGGD
jgi:hypothetical protein